MKVLQVAPYFSPYPGGQERYIHNLSKYLSIMGHEVHIITSNYPRGKSFEKIDGITIERNNVLVRILRNPITPGFFKIKDYIQDFDVVHVHNEHSFSAMVAAFLKSKNNFPLILTNHGQLRFDSFFADLVEKIYAKSIGKIIFRKADRIVALSLSDANYISSFGKKFEKISILPNAIDTTEFASYADKQNTDFLKKYKLDGKKIVLFVGQIIQRKGVKYLMRSISYVINEFPNNNILFLIVGKGDFSEKAKEIVRSLNIGDSVLFTGEISFDDLVQAYKSADVYVLPSLSEGMPTTILEAMYFGLPVVATDIPGVRDHFKDFALLVPPKNEKELANALLKFLTDDDLVKKMSIAGKKLVETKYTWDIVTRQYCEVYKKLILDMRPR